MRVTASVLVCGALLAASCASDRLPGVTAQGRLLQAVPPDYPLMYRQIGDEGWALISIVVRRDGSVAAPIVEDAVSSLYASEALRAVRQWKWQPPKFEGRAVERTQTVLIPFELRDPVPTGSHLAHVDDVYVAIEFGRLIKDIGEQLDSGDLKGAERALAELEQRGLSLRQRVPFFLLDARLGAAKGESFHQLQSLKRALLCRAQSLDPTARDATEATIFALQIQHQQLRDALDTYDRMLARRRTPPPAVVAGVARIRAALASSEPILTSGHLALRGEIEAGDAPSVWSHALLRRTLAVQDVNGALESVELRCQRHREVRAAPVDRLWRLAESWGDCSLYVFGTAGTTFTLAEYPLEAAQGTPTPNGGG